jgi:outer membrane receptor for ferrienterochelin and colicin
MFAASQPPAIAALQSADDQDVIEIVGRRADQTLKIDRRTYQVQQTQHSQQKDAIQLLRGLPAVTVSPDDTISLLGTSDVRIFVDGRPYQGDATQYLRTLHGGDVERIEVITNPSAQYSAEGTGGIINFVLRKKQGDGLSGNVSSEAARPSGGKANGSLKYKDGQWTYELSGGVETRDSRSTYHKRRSVEQTPGGAATINTEDGGGPSRSSGGFASGKIGYDIEPKTTLSAKITGFDTRDRSDNNTRFEAVTPDFESFSGAQRRRSSGSWLFGELAFDHKGSREGETLTASLQLGKNRRQRETNHSSFSDGATLFTQRLKGFSDTTAQVDWQHPMGKGEILSLGGTWDRSTMTEAYRFESSGTDLSGFTAADQFSGRDDKLAAYMTFQQPIAGWTVMPGVRLERDSRRITSRGHPDVAVAQADLFPTLHVDRALSPVLDLTLSYSKRIDRPGLNDLRPYAIVQDVLTVKQGNPRLKDQSTGAYEINLHYHRRRVDAGIIIYDRETSRLWSPDYTAINGVSVFSMVNSGHRRSIGAEFDAATPILPHLKLNTSVNLFYVRAPTDGTDGRGTQSTFRYTSDSTLEWDAPDRGKTAGDVAQVEWRHYSRTSLFQIEDFARNGLSMSYTHSFSRALSLTATMDYWAPFAHRLRAPLVQELYRETDPIQFRLKLLKTFGSP